MAEHVLVVHLPRGRGHALLTRDRQQLGELRHRVYHASVLHLAPADLPVELAFVRPAVRSVKCGRAGREINSLCPVHVSLERQEVLVPACEVAVVQELLVRGAASCLAPVDDVALRGHEG